MGAPGSLSAVFFVPSWELCLLRAAGGCLFSSVGAGDATLGVGVVEAEADGVCEGCESLDGDEAPIRLSMARRFWRIYSGLVSMSSSSPRTKDRGDEAYLLCRWECWLGLVTGIHAVGVRWLHRPVLDRGCDCQGQGKGRRRRASTGTNTRKGRRAGVRARRKGRRAGVRARREDGRGDLGKEVNKRPQGCNMRPANPELPIWSLSIVLSRQGKAS
jgi:hypothetical protein